MRKADERTALARPRRVVSTRLKWLACALAASTGCNGNDKDLAGQAAVHDAGLDGSAPGGSAGTGGAGAHSGGAGGTSSGGTPSQKLDASTDGPTSEGGATNTGGAANTGGAGGAGGPYDGAAPTVALVRVAALSPDLPAVRVCLRLAGESDYSFELTRAPDLTARCGNQFTEGTESCDGPPPGCDPHSATGDLSRCNALCASATSGARPFGAVSCNDDCTWNTGQCRAQSCGDGFIDGNEECDGNVANSSCEVATRGTRPRGTLACSNDCKLDTTGCIAAASSPSCGNGVIDDGEDCDGAELHGATCASTSLGALPGGHLACSSTCSFDLSGCVVQLCGDGVRSGTEECDGNHFTTTSCYYATGGTRLYGEPTCRSDCTIDASSCNTGVDIGLDAGVDAGAAPDGSTVRCPLAAEWKSQVAPPPPGIADGLDYTEVTAYTRVPALAFDVKLVGASDDCTATGLVTASVDLTGDVAATLVVSGRRDPDDNPATADGDLRIVALPDYGGLLFRVAATIDDAPTIDAWFDATGGPSRGRRVDSFPSLTYASSTSPTSDTVVADGYASASGLSLDWFSLALIERDTNTYLGSFPLRAPSVTNAVSAFIHGALTGPNPEGVHVLECDEYGRPVNGLTPCVDLPFECAPFDVARDR